MTGGRPVSEGKPASRAGFSTRLGTICATAGVAIGLGNVWRFPYMMGRDGGSAFLALYLVFFLGVGAPMLMCELALGRATRRGPWGAYQRAGLRWGRGISVGLLVTITMSASYYGIVVAWVLQEAVLMGGGAMGVVGGDGCGPATFARITESVGEQYLYLAVTIGMGAGALATGVRRGIEWLSRLALPLFVVIFVLVMVRALTLEGGKDGLVKFLAPRPEALTWKAALSALGQVVFSLGVGGMFMVMYGSYLREDEDIPSIALGTLGADLGASLLAGLIVMPAVFATGVDSGMGPSLLFEAMPRAFARMPLGFATGAGFFLAIFVVAMLSLMAAYEAVVAAITDGLGWSRGSALVVVVLSQLGLALPAYFVARYIEVSDLIWGSTMQPLGGAVAVVALVWGLGRARALDEIRRSSRLPIPVWLMGWCRYGVPVVMLVVLVGGWLEWLGVL